jgi:hypothetical protein
MKSEKEIREMILKCSKEINQFSNEWDAWKNGFDIGFVVALKWVLEEK